MVGLLFTALLIQRGLQPVSPVELGRQRQTFGQKFRYASDAYMSHYTWMYYMHWDSGPSEMYFPVGIASQRFMLTGINGAEPYKEWYLNYQTKHGKTIGLEWKVKLPYIPPPASYEGMRTLEAMLARRGLSAPAKSPQKVRESLKVRKPLAGYWLEVLGLGRYWFVDVGGTEKEATRAKNGLLFGPSDKYPVTDKPYPITKLERRFLK